MLSDKEATIKLELSQIESKYKMVIPSVDEARYTGIEQPLFKRNRMPISLTTGLIWFSFTVTLLRVLEKVPFIF